MKMSELEKIKAIAEQMPNGPEKQQGLQAYSNLKMFETIANSFDKIIKGEKQNDREQSRIKNPHTYFRLC
jgi:hypothetical protein